MKPISLLTLRAETIVGIVDTWTLSMLILNPIEYRYYMKNENVSIFTKIMLHVRSVHAANYECTKPQVPV